MTELTKSTAGAGEPATQSVVSPTQGEPAIARVTQWGEIRHRFLANRLAVVGLLLVTVLFLTAIFAPLIAPADPYHQDLNSTLQSPGGAHWLGTDALGRDQFSRIIYGTRIAVEVGLASIFLACFIGIIVGALAGYFGKATDSVLMRIADVFFAFPLLIGAIVIIIAMGRGVMPVIISLAVFSWPTVSRLLRSSILSVREADYVLAARALGASTSRIIIRHIIPNSIAAVMAYAAFSVGGAIVAEASLSFLGVGVSPEVPEWGNMLASAKDFLGVKDYLWVYPSVAIVLTVLGFVFVGDGLRDALDPKLR
ncbi:MULTISPECIES: ABC transporter permease [unclassified Streptomyces]|uniref:ABC transporter permease n=1 Tax=unclassified Streptomyces TaxID=2593676 RepID=UPI002DD9C7AD|nr:ABC transporter permease [Streptomyces sp. NBC_01750]WSB00529.1 ABC transporter permease [Streptomyces sp. NBC_01794]WSD35114.1 ABC transporter permease [Streptomyces sp. NBC_01750]